MDKGPKLMVEGTPTMPASELVKLIPEAPNEDTAAEGPPLEGVLCRSKRTRTRTIDLQQCIEQGTFKLHSSCVLWEVFHDQSNDIKDSLQDRLTLAVSSNPDVLHLNEAMVAPNEKEFCEAMFNEVESHTDNDHWEVTKREDIPPRQPVLPAAWAFRRKLQIATQEVHKWKVRLNLHGGRQEHGVNCWETHAPTVGWSAIRMFLMLSILNDHQTRQVDFVLAFPQANTECDMHMKMPQVFKFGGSRKRHCLKLKKNLCGQRQACSLQEDSIRAKSMCACIVKAWLLW